MEFWWWKRSKVSVNIGIMCQCYCPIELTLRKLKVLKQSETKARTEVFTLTIVTQSWITSKLMKIEKKCSTNQITKHSSNSLCHRQLLLQILGCTIASMIMTIRLLDDLICRQQIRKEWSVSNKNSCVEIQTTLAYLNPILLPDDYKYLNDVCKTCL